MAPGAAPELDDAALPALRTQLLRWYRGARRELPWRTSRDPYHVLVSELMLQQTRVDVVLPYFARWVLRWPDVRALAAASEDDVLAAWSGLGYYRRARALHAAAREIVARHGGVVPRAVDALRALPGVGPYTAAAVASIAYDVPAAVVDGNVERVLCRLLGDARPPSAARARDLRDVAERLLAAPAGDWNQALMELGALVCVPSAPRCDVCPWAPRCVAHARGDAARLPVRAAPSAVREVVLRMAVVRRGDAVLLVRRGEGALLAGMWELPTTDEGGSPAQLGALVRRAVPGARVHLAATAARSFRHAITRRRITVHVHEGTCGAPVESVAEAPPGIAWAGPRELGAYAVSSMTTKALAGSRRAT